MVSPVNRLLSKRALPEKIENAIKETDPIQFQKKICRQKLKDRRDQLSLFRREQAAKKAFHTLACKVESHSLVLSYASFGSELNVWELNLKLAADNKLALPRIIGNKLRLFTVSDLSKLERNRFGILEPNPALCPEVKPELISLALVPGLGFDPENQHRIGYGKGFYDRLLSTMRKEASKEGIGFLEQQMTNLPISSSDISLQHLWLF